MAGPFKMKAGKEGPMKKNFPSAFKKDKKSVQDNTKKSKIKVPELKSAGAVGDSPVSPKMDDAVGDFFNTETIAQTEAKEYAKRKAKRKAENKKKAQKANAKKRAEIAKKEANYIKKAKKLVKSGNAKKGKDYQTKDDLNKKIKIIKDNS